MTQTINNKAAEKMKQNTAQQIQNTISRGNGNLSQRLSSKIGLLTVLITAVCAVVLIAHWPALSAEAFVFDDDQYLTENLLVQNPGWQSARRFLTEVLEPSTVEGYYQPLTMISLMLDYALGGRPDWLRPFHRTSLALHTVNTALVIVFLYLLFGRAWIAAAVGLLFGVHPMTVETIPWVGERKTLLAAFFALWCLILYVRYTRKNNWKLYAGGLMMYLLALMSKPTSTPLPLLMLLMDYWPLNRFTSRSIFEKVPFFVFGFISAIITYISQARTAGADIPVEYMLGSVPLIICHNIIFYLSKIVWPSNLSSFYAFPQPLSLSNTMVLAGVIGSLALISVLITSLRWTPAALTGWLFFFVAILPAMQIIGFSDVIASDKFAYLPSIGLLIVLCSFLYWFCGEDKSVSRGVITATAILILSSAEIVATRRYLFHWHDTKGLYEYMLSLTPNAPPVLNNLGIVLASEGKVDQAINHFRKALQLKPSDYEAHNNLAMALQSQGQLDEAIDHYLKAIEQYPDDPKVHNNLGCAFYEKGMLYEAALYLRQSLRLSPAEASAHLNLANVLKQEGEFDEAISHLLKALELQPNFSKAYNTLGIILSLQGKLDDSIAAFEKALQQKPNDVEAHYNLANALYSKNDADEAIRHYLQALQADPNYYEAHNNLGLVLKSQGRLNEAIEHYEEALRLKPDYAKGYNNLGNAYLTQGKLDEAILQYYRALELDPDYSSAGENLARALELQNKLNSK